MFAGDHEAALQASLRRRLNAVPPIRWLLTRRPVEHVVATVNRSAVVHDRLRFLGRELLLVRAVSRYRLRESGGTVLVRHRTPDVVTLDEVFLSADYALPADVVTWLASVSEPPRVLDLGANVGYFGVAIAGRRNDVRITAVEPDPANAEILRRVAAANPGAWEIVEAIAGARAGETIFYAGAFSLSRLAEAGAAPPGASPVRVPTLDALELLRRSHLAKIDIEGGEWAILCDERFPAAVPNAIVLEYHPQLCPERDPHGLARLRLGAAGLSVTTVWRRDDGHGVVWGWKDP